MIAVPVQVGTGDRSGPRRSGLCLIAAMLTMLWSQMSLAQTASNPVYRVISDNGDCWVDVRRSAAEGNIIELYRGEDDELAWIRSIPFDGWGRGIRDAWIRDDGYVIVRRAHFDLIGLEPTHGNLEFELNLETILERDNQSQRLPRGSDGFVAAWPGFSFAYFTRFDERDCFVLHYWWGHDVIIDLRNGLPRAATERPPDADMTTALRAAIASALAIGMKQGNLLRAIQVEAPSPDVRYRTHRLKSAVVWAGYLGITEAIPDLQLIEETFTPKPYAPPPFEIGSPLRPVLGDDEVLFQENPIRSLARFSLKRLGAPVSDLEPRNVFGKVNRERITPGIIDRNAFSYAEILALDLAGMTERQVIEALGTPDFIPAYPRRDERITWDYDLRDAEVDHTLRLTFAGHRVLNWEVLRPPEWSEIGRREAQYFHSFHRMRTERIKHAVNEVLKSGSDQ